MGPDLDAYRLYYRFLETDDEYFNYNTGDIPEQGRWHVCGLHLPDEVLEKIYAGNARQMTKAPAGMTGGILNTVARGHRDLPGLHAFLRGLRGSA